MLSACRMAENFFGIARASRFPLEFKKLQLHTSRICAEKRGAVVFLFLEVL
jgi:hypothetical protein